MRQTFLFFGLTVSALMACTTPASKEPTATKPSTAAEAAVPMADLDALLLANPSIAKLSKLEAIFSLALSPDGQTLAFISNREGKPQLFKKDLRAGKVTKVPTLNDQLTKVLWSPDGQWLALGVQPAGGLNSQVYLLRPDGSGLKRITPGGEEGTAVQAFSDDGKKLFLSSNRAHAEAYTPIIYDIATQTSVDVPTKVHSSISGVSRDGRYVLIDATPRRSRADVILWDLQKGNGQPLHVDDSNSLSHGEGFDAEGRWIYAASNEGSDTMRLVRAAINPAGKMGPMEEVLAHKSGELEWLVLSHDRKTLALVWNEKGLSGITLWDLKTRKETTVNLPLRGVVGGLFFAQNNRSLVYTLTDPSTPRRVLRYDIASGGNEVLLATGEGEDLPEFVRSIKALPVSYPAEDGVELSGWLYLPKDFKKPGPVIFSFHGGPEGQSRPVFNTLIAALLQENIAVFEPNVRGSYGYGKRFVNLDNGPLRVNSVKDIRASVNKLVKDGIAAPGQLGIYGGSYGGYMVMAGVTEFPDLFAAGANLFGIVNFRSFFQHSQAWMAAISKTEYGDPATEGAMLDALSPINKLEAIKASLLVMHGRQDTNVPIQEAEQIVETMKAQKRPVRYVLFEDEGHGWRNTDNRQRSNAVIVDFFKRSLKVDR